MKNTKENFKEIHKLPITFRYAEVVKKNKNHSKVVYFITCDTYQTNFLTKEEPYKQLIRLL